MARFIDLSLPDAIKEAPESYRDIYKSKVLNNLYNATSNSKGIIDFSGHHSHPTEKLLQWTRDNKLLSVPSVCVPSNELLEVVASKIDVPANHICFAPDERSAVATLITKLSEPKDAFLVLTPLTPLLDGIDHMTSTRLIDVSLDSKGCLSSPSLQNAFDSARFQGYNICGILHSLDSNYESLTSFVMQHPYLHVIRTCIPSEKPQPQQHLVISLSQMPGSLCAVISQDSNLLRRCSAEFPSSVLQQQFMLSAIKAGCPLLDSEPKTISDNFLEANNLKILHQHFGYHLLDFSVFAKIIRADITPHAFFNLLLDHGIFLLPGIALRSSEPFAFALSREIHEDVLREGFRRLATLQDVTAAAPPANESLENLVRDVFKGIKSSPWIEANEGSWAAENPDAAAELFEIIKKGGGGDPL